MGNLHIGGLQSTHDLLGIVFFGFIGVLVVGYLLSFVVFYFLNNHKKHYVATIRFPEIAEEEKEKYLQQMKNVFDAIFKRIYSQTDKVFFEVLKTQEYIVMQIGSNNEEILEHIKQAFSQIANIEILETQQDELQSFKKVFTKSIYTSEPFYPINKNISFFDAVINILAGLPKEEQAGIQFVLRGVNKKLAIHLKIQSLEKRRIAEKRLLPTDSERRLTELYEFKRDENIFKTKIYVFSTNKQRLASLISLFSTLNFNNNSLCSQIGFESNMRKRYLAPDTPFAWWIPVWREAEGSYFTSSELATLIHPIHISRGTYAPKQVRDIEAIPEMLEQTNTNILIGKAGNERSLYYPIRNFERHIYTVGKTGRGKSTLLVTMLIALQRKKLGNMWVIDPHGDLLRDTINSLESLDRISYFTIKDTERVFTINPLFAYKKSQLQKAALKDIILDVIKRETEEQTGGYQSGSMTQNRIEQIVELALEFPDAYLAFLIKKGVAKDTAKQLVGERQITLNDLPYLLVPEYNYLPLFRAVFSEVNSPAGRYVSRQMATHQNQQAVVEAVQSRLKQLLHSSLQYIFEGNKFDIESAINSDETFLLPIQKPIFGTRGTHILMQVLFSLLWNYKQEKESNRKNTYVFIDEFQNAQIRDIPEIIAEGRKYKLFLTLSNQQLGQLLKPIKDAILGNIGTIFSFAVGADEIGAKTLAPYFGDTVTEKDLTMLPPYQAYLKTEGSKEKPSITLSFKTIALNSEEKDNKTVKNINKTTLEKYGEKISVLEERLNKKQENPLKYFTEGI